MVHLKRSHSTAIPPLTLLSQNSRGSGLLRPQTKVRTSKYLNNLVEQDHRRVKQRVYPMLVFKGFKNTMKSPTLYKISGKAGRLGQKPLAKSEALGPMPGPLGAWANSRDLPQLAEKSFRELWKEGI